jgi:hypothetical protein
VVSGDFAEKGKEACGHLPRYERLSTEPVLSAASVAKNLIAYSLVRVNIAKSDLAAVTT